MLLIFNVLCCLPRSTVLSNNFTELKMLPDYHLRGTSWSYRSVTMSLLAVYAFLRSTPGALNYLIWQFCVQYILSA